MNKRTYANYYKRYYLLNKERNKGKPNLYQRVYVAKNREKVNDSHKEYYRKIKGEVLGQYSEGTFQCAICGGKENLSIDHINLNGNAHRQQLHLWSSSQFYLWLRKNNFPKGYRILCRQCNSRLQPERKSGYANTSRLVLNYLRTDGIPYSYREIISDLTPSAPSERAIIGAIQRLHKNGKITRTEKGFYKCTIPQPSVIPEPKHPTGYKPHEVAFIIGYSRAILLQWEKKGLITPPKQRPSGYRDYSRDDVLQLIQFADTYGKTHFP